VGVNPKLCHQGLIVAPLFSLSPYYRYVKRQRSTFKDTRCSRFGERTFTVWGAYCRTKPATSAHQTIYRHASRFGEHSRSGEPYLTVWGAQVHGMRGEYSRFGERKARSKTALNPVSSITYANEHFPYTNIILCNRQQQHKTLCCCRCFIFKIY
jgi:hypothetical protein